MKKEINKLIRQIVIMLRIHITEPLEKIPHNKLTTINGPNKQRTATRPKKTITQASQKPIFFIGDLLVT